LTSLNPESDCDLLLSGPLKEDLLALLRTPIYYR
jgi:hypothetical protein